MGYWNYYPAYTSVAEKKEKAQQKLEKLRKKNPGIRPVVIRGKSIANTWWGKSWNVNLERYADYDNRIGRGRSYVRNGMVLDLQISPGEVTALVQGTASQPYSVVIRIKGIEKNIWNQVKEACQGKLDSLGELLAGKFPKDMGEVFMAKGEGLFPSPEEISFSCSCPDWASMCKHVAAALYGVGARLDEDPMLFFRLRNVEVNDLITQAVKDKTEKLLEKARKKTSRVMDESNIADVFGIELENETVEIPKIEPPSEKLKKSKSAKEKLLTSKPIKLQEISAAYIVYEIIGKSRKGIDLKAIAEKTGFDEKKIYQIVYRLKKQGRIIDAVKGIYRKK
ncbi:MAG: hypothetical protein BWK80_55935 [Desulfobacteraceae bacterium IS3]|nr:MAG: hypothetical protein BWK80_55935 [Desulfobacteraceae bacterium IS3]